MLNYWVLVITLGCLFIQLYYFDALDSEVMKHLTYIVINTIIGGVFFIRCVRNDK